MPITFSYSTFVKAVLHTAIFFISQLILAHSSNGYVRDNNGQPVKDVYVLHSISGNHAHTNAKVFFSLDAVEKGGELRFSHIGYEAASLTITDEKVVLQITLNTASLDLEAITITNDVETLNALANVDVQINPVTSSQEILRTVPGLFIGQHAGGGKAEQIFLRGFDIDHGTDIAIHVDGTPVNMVSHAHGQGYADLHFLIPETINNISYGIGSYDESVGNFATAGHVDFRTKSFLSENRIGVEIGDFNHQRYLGMLQLVDNSHTSAYIATEYVTFDGAFDSPQNFDRINLFGKLHHTSNNGHLLGVSLSHFDSQWDASGQIPQRAIDRGWISRFGSIDDTEGGQTSRTNLVVNYDMKLTDMERLQTTVFYSQYDFSLFSNFTFFLEDPINGDQIKQQESRNTAGFKVNYTYETELVGNRFDVNAGLGFRNDRTEASSLSRTLNRRETLENIQLGDINETNSSLFIGVEWYLDKLLIDTGLRLERFKFSYKDALAAIFDTQSQTATALLPKLNFNYKVSNGLKVYLRTGIGLHSNDTRVVLENSADKILPKSYGSDLGTIWKANDKLVIDGAVWYLYLEQEFVYVGDAGVVEPSGETQRYGFDLGGTYQLSKYVFIDTNLNYAHARAINEPDGADFIPLAPEFTSAGGISLKNYKKFNAGCRYRYIGDRAANEYNSILAEGYFVADIHVNYDVTKGVKLGIAVQNLFNVAWNETQFATESRLVNETQSVEEIHVTPGTPFFIRGSLQYRF
jgi:outer membrane receptor protein involved in Fe transport